MPSVQPLKLVLVERRYSQARLARTTGYSQQWIVAVVNGRATPGPAFMRTVAAELGMPATRLFREAQELTAVAS